MLDSGVNVLWFSKEKYMSGNGVPEHSHSFFHYIYILDGAAKISINGRAFLAHKDELFLVQQRMRHSIEAVDSHGLQVIEVKFEVNSKELESDVAKLETHMRLPQPKVRMILEGFILEGMEKGSYFADLINLRFTELLVHLIRNSTGCSSREKEVEFPDGARDARQEDNCFLSLKKVVAHMKSNYREEMELDKLARMANMSKYYFCRNFKRVYNTSPMKFLNRLRISKAKELMMGSGLNISEIAYHVGFEDTCYFSRFFRQCEGMSPNEYMLKYKPNLYFFLSERQNELDYSFQQA